MKLQLFQPDLIKWKFSQKRVEIISKFLVLEQ